MSSFKDNYATKSVSFVCYFELGAEIDAIIFNKYDFIEYAYILHDKEEGVKPHYHVYIRFNNKKNYKALATDFNIDSSLINAGNGLRNFLTYVSHKYEKDKFKYDLSTVGGVFDRDIVSNFDILTDTQILHLIFEKIGCGYTYSEVVKFCLQNDYMKTLRLYNQIIKDYLYNTYN